MKAKILTLAAITLLAVSCGTKKTASTPATPATPAVTETAKAVELTPELAAGKSMYENNCAKCHKLYEPKKFTQEEWAPILVRMQKKAHLDDTQMASITSYIHSQL
ncbi:Dihaem cytochrome c [Flavobacterium aquidurense]|uniref:Cytochrome C n=1 Tax=Flavobacterium frigidimaris TaxID=262320 RepID=A0ABX4BM12_FLAFR|nr:cytochrome C [Flavobacterium frigidimaris]OXA76616.1 cytochrome C [Flavobacterium frigidimaris]SDY22792.1 Dihaem cytochrome c [Flavobacterium aquidurense]